MKKFIALSVCAIFPLMAPVAFSQTSSSSSSPTTPAPATTPGSSGSMGGSTAPSGTSGGTGSYGTGSGTGAAGMGATDTGKSMNGASHSGTGVNGSAVKEDLVGKTVYNENGDSIGEVQDVVVSNGKATQYVIGAGGFLGMGKHDVAIPFDKVSNQNGKLILSGYTKEQLKALPAVK
jgi:sporulation protein YlmC with PRC-barrel domain